MKSKTLYLFLVLLLFLLYPVQLYSQTKGLIIKPAEYPGKLVLDPDTNGMVSKSPFGFELEDELESEVPFKRLVLPWLEPSHDLSKGPGCGFTDFVDDPTRYSSSYSYYDPSSKSLMFRFRLGGYAPNSKGYSVLIDADSKFGFTGTEKDPNAVTGNPGFEFEILLATNFGVRLIDVDGTANPGAAKCEMPYTTHCQKSIAHSETCDMDFFYDFFIPFDSITKYFPSVTPSTPLRMVANTVINPHTALRNGGNSISDMSGIDDGAFGGFADNMFQEFISQVSPVSSIEISTAGFPPIRLSAPLVSSPIRATFTSISGTMEAVSGVTVNIDVFKNGLLFGSTSTSGTSWALTGVSGLLAGDSITAVASASGYSSSQVSNLVVVIEGLCTTSSITITAATRKCIQGTATAGTIVHLYGPDNPNNFYTSVTTNGSGAWAYYCNTNASNCNSGNNCQNNGQYFAQAGTGCLVTANGCSGNTITSSTLNTITPATINTATDTIKSNAVSSSRTLMYINGLYYGSFSASLAIPANLFVAGDILTFYFIETEKCMSTTPVSRTVQAAPMAKTTTPVVNAPLLSGDFLVSGSSMEVEGTKIYIYINGSLSDSTTVNNFGFWSKSLSTSLSGGQVVTARALAPSKTISDLSNSVTILTRATPPVLTGTYNEASTSVSGTVPPGTPLGSKVYVYVDGILLDSVTTDGSTSWSLTGLAAGELYAGGLITATLKTNGGESLHSNGILIDCITPNLALSINVINDGKTCLNTSARIEVQNTEPGVIYTLKDLSNTVERGTSVLGDGRSKIVGTLHLVASENFKILAQKLPKSNCDALLDTTIKVTVTWQEGLEAGLNSNDFLWLGSTGSSDWDEKFNWIQWDDNGFKLTTEPPTSSHNVVIKKQDSCIFKSPVTTLSATAVCQDLVIHPEGELSFDGNESSILTVTGNWVNQGTFNAVNGTVRFSGNKVQTIETTGPLTFHRLEVVGGETRLRLLDNIQVGATGTLVLYEGAIDLNNQSLTVLNTSVNAISRSGQGRVISETQSGEGILYRATSSNTNYVFPMGTLNGEYVPVTISNDLGSMGTVGVATFRSNPMDGSSAWPKENGVPLHIQFPTYFVQRFWHLYSQTMMPFNARVTLSFDESEDPHSGFLDTSPLGMTAQRFDNILNLWALPSSPLQNYDHASRSVNIDSVTQFSWWSVSVESSLALPVSLLSFEGSCEGEANILRWSTASETNNQGFYILESENAKDFTRIGFVEGAGNSYSLQNYGFEIPVALEKQKYYKLAQMDFDGKLTETEPIALKCRGANNWLKTYPNPASKFIYLETGLEEFEYSLVNAYGIDVLYGMGHNGMKIPVDAFPPGLYTLKASNGAQVLFSKIIIGK